MIRYFGNHIQLFSRESEEVLAWRCIHTGRQPTLEESIAVHPTHAKIKGVWYEVLRPSQYRLLWMRNCCPTPIVSISFAVAGALATIRQRRRSLQRAAHEEGRMLRHTQR